MNEFLEIGEIIETFSIPVNIEIATPSTPINRNNPTPIGTKPNYSLVAFVLVLIALSILTYYILKNQKNENINSRNEL